MGALGDLLAQLRTQAASTSTPQRRNLNVNAEPRTQAADVRVDGSAGTWTWRQGLLDPPPPRPPRAGARLRATHSLQKQNATAISAVAGPEKIEKYFVSTGKPPTRWAATIRRGARASRRAGSRTTPRPNQPAYSPTQPWSQCRGFSLSALQASGVVSIFGVRGGVARMRAMMDQLLHR